jgi:hypothetical protein
LIFCESLKEVDLSVLNLVFQAAHKGEKLPEIQTGLRGGTGPPITYQIAGKQYVWVMGGTGPAPAPPANPPMLPKLLAFVLDGGVVVKNGIGGRLAIGRRLATCPTTAVREWEHDSRENGQVALGGPILQNASACRAGLRTRQG